MTQKTSMKVGVEKPTTERLNDLKVFSWPVWTKEVSSFDWYYDDKDHEAGRFLRDLSITLDGRKLDFIQDEMANKKMHIELISEPIFIWLN